MPLPNYSSQPPWRVSMRSNILRTIKCTPFHCQGEEAGARACVLRKHDAANPTGDEPPRAYHQDPLYAILVLVGIRERVQEEEVERQDGQEVRVVKCRRHFVY